MPWSPWAGSWCWRASASPRADCPAADARRLIDLVITAATDLQRRGNALVESRTPLSAKQNLQLLGALTDAAVRRRLAWQARAAMLRRTALRELLAAPSQSRTAFTDKLKEAQRVMEWAQANAMLPFAEVLPAWELVLPQTAGIRDDILRGSPLLLYAQVSRSLDDFAQGRQRIRHDLFGADGRYRRCAPSTRVWPWDGCAWRPKAGGFTRDEIVALSRDARRPRPCRRHSHSGRGQHAVARAAPGARARHPERRTRAGRLCEDQAARRTSRSSLSRRRVAE